jgi:hypothetical protein
MTNHRNIKILAIDEGIDFSQVCHFVSTDHIPVHNLLLFSFLYQLQCPEIFPSLFLFTLFTKKLNEEDEKGGIEKGESFIDRLRQKDSQLMSFLMKGEIHNFYNFFSPSFRTLFLHSLIKHAVVFPPTQHTKTAEIFKFIN